MISLGFQQYKALEALFDHGSPVHIEPVEHSPGNIVDIDVTYFAADRVTQVKAMIDADGTLFPDHKETT